LENKRNRKRPNMPPSTTSEIQILLLFSHFSAAC